MFCGSCGKELKTGQKFCGHCGTPVPQEVRLETAPAPKPARSRSTSAPHASASKSASKAKTAAKAGAASPKQSARKKKKKKKGSPLVGFLVLAAIGGFIAFAIKVQQDEQEWLNNPPSVADVGDVADDESGAIVDTFNDIHGGEVDASSTVDTSSSDLPAEAFDNIETTTANPASIPKSGVAAVDVSPAKGLRVVADKNALDKQRQFKADPLPEDQVNALYSKYAAAGIVPLGGFDLNCGMTPGDRFAAPVAVEFDLAALGVDPDLWKHTQLAYQDSDGRLRILTSERDGSNMRCEIRHNGAFLYVLFGATVALGQYYGVFDKEISDYPKSPGKDGYRSQWWKPGAARYVLFYPAEWKPADPQSVEDAQNRLSEVIEKYKLSSAPNSYAAAEIAKAMFKDPEYIAIREELDAPDFILNKFLPVRAANVVRTLDLAVEYCDERGFRAPGVGGVEWTPEVFIQAQSLGRNLYGEARNAWTTRAFLVIDGTKIPDIAPDSMNADQKKAMDTLKTTTLHEYFHIIQAAYAFVETPGQLWFAEATAVLLEAEGGTDYLSRGWAATWDHTSRGLMGYFNPLDFVDDDRSATQQHGYDASQFVEFLRQRYYSASPKSFMPKLLEDFACFRGGTVASLYRVTSNDAKKLGEDFRLFARKIRPRIVFLGAKPALTPGKPYFSWNFETPAPLSAPGLRVVADGDDFKDVLTPDCVAVLRDSSGFTEETDVTWSIDATQWKTLKAGLPASFNIPAIPPGRTLSILIQRAEPYVDLSPTPAAGKGPMSTDIYFMLPPKAPKPIMTLEDFVVDLPKTPLLAAPEPPGMGPYVQGLELQIESDAGGDPIIKNVGLSTHLEYPLEQITSNLKPNDKGVIPARLRFREVAHKGQGIYGPWSAAAEIQIGMSKIGQIVWNKPPVPAGEIQALREKYGVSGDFALRIEVTYANGAKPTIHTTDYDMVRGIKLVIEEVDIPNIRRITEYTIFKPTGEEDVMIYLDSSIPEWSRILAGERIDAKWVAFQYTPRPVGAILRIDEKYEAPTPAPPVRSSGYGQPVGGFNPLGGLN